MKRFRIAPGSPVDLDAFDPGDTSAVPGGKQEGHALNSALQKRLGELQEMLFAEHRHSVLVVLQGMDTSGKDGTVRHVMADCSPQGVRVVSFKKPTGPELEHDYLWRVHQQAPGRGELGIFNRSHYEDVLVVRVHDAASRKRKWNARFAQINDFERMLTENGTLVLKFFLHISKKEQAERLEERISDPTKRWKFAHGDLEERKLWDDYMKAYEDALGETSTKWAPWTVVPANAKWFRNWVVGRAIVEAMESLKMRYPEPDLSKERVD